MLKLIIFDFDGPILDSFGGAKDSVEYARKKLNLARPTREDFILSWGYPGQMAVKKLFPQIKKNEVQAFIKCWAEREKEMKLPLVAGAKKSLEKIKREGYLMALVTTRSHNLKLQFGRFALEKYFDFFQSFDNPALPKEKVHPNHIFHNSYKDGPAFFENLFNWMKRNKISLKEAIFIDDTLVGLKLARKVGLPFLGVLTSPLSSKKDWQRYGNLDGKYVITSIAELPEWLEKHGGT